MREIYSRLRAIVYVFNQAMWGCPSSGETYYQGQEDLWASSKWRWTMIQITRTSHTLTWASWLNTHQFFTQPPHELITSTVKQCKVLPKERRGRGAEWRAFEKMTYLLHCYSWFSYHPLITLRSSSQKTSQCEELLHVRQKNESFSG